MEKRFLTKLLTVLCFALSALAVQAQTFNAAGLPLPIPPVGTGGSSGTPADALRTLPITVAGVATGNINAGTRIANVAINITHTFNSDLDIFLQSPSGAIYELSTDNGSSGDGYIGVTFDDNAASLITAAPTTPNITGAWRPEGTLTAQTFPYSVTPTVSGTMTAAFNGLSPNGTWNLIIGDDATGDSGSITAASITFAAQCVLPTIANITANNTPGLCAASVTVPLPVVDPASCAGVTFTNSYNGGANASDTYPVGTTTVTYTFRDATGAVIGTRTFTVTVRDTQGPTIVAADNCKDITLHLGSGECRTQYSPSLMAMDNCPLEIFTAGTLTAATTSNNSQNGIMFDLRNNTAGTMQINSFTPRTTAAGSQTFRIYATIGNTYNGVNANPAAWTLIGTVTANFAGAPATATLTLPTPITIAAGQCRGIYLLKEAGAGFIQYNGVTGGATVNTFTDGRLTLFSGIGINFPTAATPFPAGFFGTPAGPCTASPATSTRAYVGGVGYSFLVPFNPLTQTAGPAAGSFLEAGTTTRYTFVATDVAGNTTLCDYRVTVAAAPATANKLTCADQVNISLDDKCEATVTAADVLRGTGYTCFDAYTVTLYYINSIGKQVPVPGNKITRTWLNKQLIYEVVAPNGNKCWGYVIGEDKQVPALTCRDYTVPCDANIRPGTNIPSATSSVAFTTPITIVDAGNNSATQAVTLPAEARINDVNVKFVTNHTWVGDLSATLVSPAGTTVTLFARPGNPAAFFGCAGDGLNVNFDDEAAQTNAQFEAICGNNPAIAGDFQPQSALSAFDGQNPSGNWTLNLNDAVGGDAGQVTEFVITINHNLTIRFPVGNATVRPQTALQRARNEWTIAGFDGCGDATLTYVDQSQNFQCANVSRRVTRTWTITDLAGNKSTCVENFSLTRATLADLVAPRNYDNMDLPALLCDDENNATPRRLTWNRLASGPYAGNPDPAVTGFPSGVDCGDIQFTYHDLRINICKTGASNSCFKVLRTWNILDWCTGQQREIVQVIKVEDDQAPVINDLDDLTISTDVWACAADYLLPKPWIMDGCNSDLQTYPAIVDNGNGTFGSTTLNYTVSAPAGITAVVPRGSDRYLLQGMEIGDYDITITAADCCGNVAQEVITITVIDDVPPVAICDRNTVVSLTTTQNIDKDFLGSTKMLADVLDDGSYDACQLQVYFKVIRMDELPADQQAPSAVQRGGNVPANAPCTTLNGDDNTLLPGVQVYFDDFTKFCCADAGRTRMVIFRVYDVDPGAGPVSPNRHLAGGDLYNRFNDCMVEVDVQEKQPPFIVAPSNLTVTCDYWFDINNLNKVTDATFGKVVTYAGIPSNATPNRDSIIIFDRICGLRFKPGQGDVRCFDRRMQRKSLGIDGYAIDNCGAEVTISVDDQRVCGQGTIARTFTARDASGRTARATQFITIVDCEPYNITNTLPADIQERFPQVNPTLPKDCRDGVMWPRDVQIETCGGDPELAPATLESLLAAAPADIDSRQQFVNPPFTGANDKLDARPQIYFEDNCSLVGVTYKDTKFPFADGCFKIVRLWKVVDWCQFDDKDPDLDDLDQNGDDGFVPGYWEYLQTIKVINTIAPEISVAQNACTEADAVDGCLFKREIKAVVTDDCSAASEIVVDWKLDAFNDGRFDAAGRGTDASTAYTQLGIAGFPVGTHRILWSAEDKCGNVGSSTFIFEIKDCKAPTPKLFVGIATATMPSTGKLTLRARWFDKASYDNCTSNPKLRFSFSANPADSTFTYDCATNVPADNIVTHTLYVTDEAGNQRSTQVYVYVAGCNSQAGINGIVANEDNDGVQGATISVDGTLPNGMANSVITDASGSFSFNGLNAGENYSVKAEKDGDYLNGVSTLDLVLISKHILGTKKLDSPYKLIAADVNKSGTITGLDIVELRKLILYIDTKFKNNTSWRFVEKSFQFADATNPFKSTFPEVISINSLNGQSVADFVAVKVGDVNGSAKANNFSNAGEGRSTGALTLVADDRTLAAGEEVQVAVRAQNLNEVLGYQFTMNYDRNLVEVVDVKAGNMPNMSAGNFGMLNSRGAITTSYNADRSVSLSSDEALFTLTVRAKKATQLSSALSVSSELTAAEAYTAGEKWDVNLVFTGANAEFALFQNSPNPFKDETVIGFNLPQAGAATLTVFDAAGKSLRVIEGEFAKGFNQVTINRGDLGAAGVLYYQLQSGDFSATKKMVVIE